MSGFEVISVDDLDAIPLPEGLVWRPVRRRFDIRAFGINAWESEGPGSQVVEEHDESTGGAGGHEELYLVVRGRARFTIDGEHVDAPAGTLVFIRDPSLRRGATAAEPGTLVVAIGGEPGRAFEVSPWEWPYAAVPSLRAGRFDEAAATIAEGLERFPGNPSLLYELACAEALAGRAENAIAHLREAIEQRAGYRERARNDPDFDTIRDLPGFPAEV